MPVTGGARPARNSRNLWLAGLLALSLVPVSLSAQGTLPEWGRPLTPAQGRTLRAEIERLSRQLGVAEATLFAIARAAGTNLRSISFTELIELVRAQAGRAAELQTRNAALQAQIAALADAGTGDSERTLARAVAAFNQGRLDDADREYAALESLHRLGSEAARAAWADAVEARARVAELRLDYDRAESLRVSAAREEQRATTLSVERQWLFMYEAALARYLQGEIRGDNAALERALVLYRDEALPLAPRAERPVIWGLTQNDIGITLLALGERDAGTARLRQAVAALEAALQVRTRERAPIDWAMTMENLGNAYFRLGGREGRARWFRRSVIAHQEVLEVFTREQVPVEWAQTQVHLANAISALGAYDRRTARLEQAVQLYQSALEELSREQVPSTWAMAQNNLGAALRTLGQRKNDPLRLQQAADTYELVVQAWTRDQYPLRWAMAQYNLGLAQRALGELSTGTTRLEQAVLAFEAALQESTRERTTATWASITASIADTIRLICERTRECARLDEAERKLREVQAVLQIGGRSVELIWANYVLRRIAATRRRLAR